VDLIDKLQELSSRIPKQLEHISTEEATKNALVMPFINALGYNVFDPTEVVPEFVADVGTKKGEKVDYAILKDGRPIILFEVKSIGTDLAAAHASQLFRYFSVTSARFGVLTNGILYHFFSDLEAPNKMDEKPFLIIDLTDINESLVAELKKFTKSSFDEDDILSTANDLKYRREITNLIAAEYGAPSEGFVKHFAGQVYTRRFTQSVVTEFTDITREAFRAFVNRKIEERLKSALNSEVVAATETNGVPQSDKPQTEAAATEDEIVTTSEETEAFYIVRAILAEKVDTSRIAMRDVRSYCGILFDDNNRRPICRLHFNRTQKYLGLFDDGKTEEKVPIDKISDIYKYAERLRKTLSLYLPPEKPAHE
jgi:predicted type IV restriction endonuclease